jgi:hypothetical protein
MSNNKPKFYLFREKVSLKELREQDEKDKEKEKKKKLKKVMKGKAKPYLNPDNKILLPTRESIAEQIRHSNRTAILIDNEFNV